MTERLGIQMTPAPRGNYVLLSADTLHILLPQHEVGAVTYLEAKLTASDVPGVLQLAEEDNLHRFAALSKHMTLLSENPPNRFLIASLQGDDANFAWCWNDLKVLTDVELQLHQIPPVLLSASTPVKYYVELKDTLAYLCSSAQLRKFSLGAGN